MKIFVDIKNIFIEKHEQYRAFFMLSASACALAITVHFLNPGIFNHFIGFHHSIIIFLGSVFLGALLTTYLICCSPFEIYRKQNIKSWVFIISLALFFGIEVIIADIGFADYSSDINIPFPRSLLFYPAIGYFAEILFHLLPITILIFLFSSFRLSGRKMIWIIIILVSLIEPIFQFFFTTTSSLLTSLYTGIHVFLFSLSQLYIFKRYDFISMYMFRLIFYFIWHILWGYLRLDILF